MKYSICCILFFLLFVQVGWSQNNNSINNGTSIKGTLIDTNNETIPYATLSLFNAEKELIQGAISEDDGTFELGKIPLGNYWLDIEYLGYEKMSREISLTKKNKKNNLGEIVMKADEQQLEEVTVTAEKSEYSFKLGRKIFNVGQDVLSQGGSALDILDQVPSVSTDPTGAVLLRGNSQVLILINGRRSGLTMNNALQQISGDNIERIEVITNPSSKYDASGSAGIINIILKKNKKKGLNGQIRAEAGIPAGHSIAPSINYKNNKINLFSNLRWRYSDYNGTYSTQQTTIDNGKADYLEQYEDEDRHDDGRSGYFGLDYYINDNSSFTAAFFRARTKDSDATVLNYDINKNTPEEINILRTGNSIENRNYNQLESNYTLTFPKHEGQEFSIDFQYDFWNSNKKWSIMSEGDVIPENVGTQIRTNTKSGSDDFALKSDFIKPLKKGSEIALGVKFEHRNVSNDFLAESFFDEQWNTIPQNDNDINYQEQIAAAYVEYQKEFKAFEFQVGLRTEYTRVNINDDEHVYTDKKKYLNLFPSVNISYGLGEKHSIQLGYSRRINRPSLWSLYPYFEIKDFNVQETGNPALDPAFADVVELSFLSIHDKITINPSIYYQHINSPRQYYIEQNEWNTFIVQPINIEQRNEVGIELSMQYRPFKFMNLSAEINAFHFDQKGIYEGIDMNAKGTSWNFEVRSSFNLPKGIRLQTIFDYRGAENNAQTRTLDSYVWTIGGSKDFLKDKLNVGFRLYNILDSRELRTISESDNYYVNQGSKRYGPRYGVHILYRFNQTSRDRIRRQNRQNR